MGDFLLLVLRVFLITYSLEKEKEVKKQSKLMKKKKKDLLIYEVSRF